MGVPAQPQGCGADVEIYEYLGAASGLNRFDLDHRIDFTLFLSNYERRIAART
ncbi:hypothetical protein NB311A_04449 [Nitrobacter sp. Nb-311A]|nr:hypothetical protein NB311A_04449 [Nitrobacter sp. Nb-311A]